MYPDCWNCNMDCSVHECESKKRDRIASREISQKEEGEAILGVPLEDFDVGRFEADMECERRIGK